MAGTQDARRNDGNRNEDEGGIGGIGGNSQPLTWRDYPAAHTSVALGYQQLEQRAAADAYHMAETIWRDGMPPEYADSGDLRPFAVDATRAFIARLKQESQGIPRWAWSSQEAMASYIQQTGDRYYAAFLWTLAETIAARIKASFVVPRPTQPPISATTTAQTAHPRRKEAR